MCEIVLFQIPRPNTCDLKYIFNLVTPLTRYEYLSIATTLIPYEIIHQYNLLPLVRNRCIFLENCKGVYGFPLSGQLAKDSLTKCLAPTMIFPMHTYTRTMATQITPHIILLGGGKFWRKVSRQITCQPVNFIQ